MEFNLADLFECVADRLPDNEALVCGARRLTYAELDRRANRVAHALAAQGVRPGDHVGLHMYNCAEFLEAMLGCFKLRAVPINVNYRYVADELRYLLDNADVTAVVAHRSFLPVLAGVRDAFLGLRAILSVDDDRQAPAAASGAVDFEAAVAAASDVRDFGPRSPDDLYIIYTGGTTGMPKGVMWRHEDVLFAGLQGGNAGGTPISAPEEIGDAAGTGMQMTSLPCAPFIHGAAQWAALICFFGGGKLVVPHGRSFDPAQVWELVERERVQVMTLVGDAMARPLADALNAGAAARDLSSLVVIASAGAVFSESVKDELRRHMDSVMLLDNFGSTESGHMGFMSNPRSASESGQPRFMLSDDVTVVDDDLQPMRSGSGDLGRLARRGRLPVGYYKDPAKTAATFVQIDGQRWVLPGDIATLDGDGMITVYGRGSACINSGGEKIFPEEIEEVLKGHPGVEDAIVVGVPDERWGERVAAVIQPRAGADPSADELDAHCREHVAGYKVPREFHMVTKIERQPSGKPDYAWARRTAVGDAAHPAGAPGRR